MDWLFESPRYAYIDESGDPGYQFAANSSPRFVVGMVVAEEPEQLIDRLLVLRRELGKPATFEFHFRQADRTLRSAFFEMLQQEPIQVLGAVIHKEYAPNDFRRLGKLGLYSHALAGLGLRAPFVLSRCRVYLDGQGKQKQFLQEVKAHVRWVCRVAGRPEQSPQDIRLLNSGSALIQCADMVTGAIAEHANQGDERWLRLLAARRPIIWHERFDDRRQKQNSLD